MALGYPGSNRSVYRYLKTLRNGFVSVFPEETTPVTPEAELPTPEPPQRARLDAFTLTQMKWFLVRDPADLEEQEVDHLTWLCQSHATLATLYDLVQRFRRLLAVAPGIAPGWLGCRLPGKWHPRTGPVCRRADARVRVGGGRHNTRSEFRHGRGVCEQGEAGQARHVWQGRLPAVTPTGAACASHQPCEEHTVGPLWSKQAHERCASMGHPRQMFN